MPRPITSLLLLVVLVGLGAFSSAAGATAPKPGAVDEAYGSGTKILGGRLDTRTDTRWVTAILSKGSASRYQRQFCGGSLIKSNYVLTAAHCLEGKSAGSLQVLVGAKHLNTSGQLRNVSAIRRYPHYNTRTKYGDIALLRLSRGASYAPARPAGHGLHYIGRMGYIAGWGNLAPFGSADRWPTRLHSAAIPIIRDRHCEQGLGSDYNGWVMLCAGYAQGHPDTCQGDSGGPLAVRGTNGWRVVGVTSFGQCGARNTFGAYAWVGSSRLRPWLRRFIGY